MSTATPQPPNGLQDLSTAKLLHLHAEVLAQLRARGLVRTGNNPVGDYAEALFARAFGWTVEANSARGHDAVDAEGQRYQIKARRLTAHNASRQLGILRNLDQTPFDHLAAVLMDERAAILRAIIVPISVVREHSKFMAHVNGWRFMLRDAMWDHPGARDVTPQLTATALTL